MAIYYLDVKMVKKSEGKSAIGASAYRRATVLYSEQEKKEFNYSKKNDVIHSEMSAPEDPPEWVNELIQLHKINPNEAAETLWNKVEAIEIRKDAQYAREIKVALPNELTHEQNIILVREFIKNQFTSHGMIADWSIHADKGNPHAHILLTTRELTESGFGNKVREWNLKNYVFRWREKWAEYTNLHLKQNQHEIGIDHRSYEAQGIGLLPLENQSQSAIEMSARGIKTASLEKSNYVRRENLRRIVSKPELALEMMASQSPSFTYEQLGQTLGRYINDKGNFSAREGEKNDVLVENTLTNFDKISGDETPKKILTPQAIADLFKKIEQHDAVFSQDDLIKALTPYTDNAEIFAKAVIEIKASPELIYLGAGVDGRDRFTTRKMFNLENEIQQNADILNNQKHIEISSKKIKETLNAYQAKTGNNLTEEQFNAVKHVLAPSSLSCIVGRAGTGKSFSLGAANIVWEAQGLRVLGVSLSGIASDGLSQGAGIKSQTLASFKYGIETKNISLNKNDVIVMDEAGMTDNDLMHFVLKETKAAKAKLVLVGDPDQLQPIGAGAVFRALLERVGFAEIQTIYRQKEAWQKQATLDFAAGRIEEGLKAYEEKGFVHIEKDREGALRLLVNDWFKLRRETQKSLKEYLVIAHSNDDVHSLNDLIRCGRIANGEIAEGYDTVSSAGALKIAKDDRLLFLKNDKMLGVKNGRFATVSSVDFTETGRVLKINVVLDSSGGKNNAAKEISIDPNQYNHFFHGYAATVHKVQGATYDHNFVYAGNGGFSWDRFLSYVAMTRHKISCHLYVNQEGGYGEFNLARQMGKKRIKDSVMDYPLSFSERRGIDTSGLLKLFPQKLADRLKGFRDDVAERYEKITKIINPKAHQLKQDQLEKLNQHKKMAKEKAQRNIDARVIADYVDANRQVGISYQSLKEKLNTLGLEKISYEPESFSVISQTTEYKNLNKATQARNRIASSFVPNIGYYSAAIEHYGLEHKKLNQHASAHESRERVLNYHSNADKIVIKDRMALNIMDNIKAHYPYLNEFSLKPQDIRKDADSHLRRSFLKGLNTEERKAFDAVERYQKLILEIGQCWAEKISFGASVVKSKELQATGKAENVKETGHTEQTQNQKTEKNAHILERSDLLHFHALNQECEKLSYEILQNRGAHHKALNFFQIGLSAPHFHYDKATESNIKDNENKATKRWYQLQQGAARHELNERVVRYQKAVYLNDTPTRLQLAHEIVQEQKAHYGAIINLDANTYGIRQALNRDAKAYEHQHFYNTLNEYEKLSFKLVDEYVKNRSAYGSAWREIFESEKSVRLDEINKNEKKKEITSKLAAFTKPYKFKRNELAEKVLLNLPDKKILDYFKVDLFVLYPQLNEHRLSEQVDQYHSEANTLKRGEMARKMVEDPSLYSKHLFEKGISWKNIYKDVKCFERQKLFDTLTQEEKQFLRLVGRYKSLQQQSGKLWAKIYQEKESQRQGAKHINDKKNKNNKFMVNEDFNKFNKTTHAKYTKVNGVASQRDALAVQVLNAKQTLELYAVMESNIYTRNPSDLILQSEGKALLFDKLQKQAENHQKRIETVNQFKDVHEGLQNTLSLSQSKVDVSSEIIVDSAWWTSVQSEINQSLKPIKANHSLYADALKQNQVSQNTIDTLEASMEVISISLNELSKINKNLPQNHVLDPDQQTKILKAQRISKGTLPIDGTLAEQYLRDHRGIQGKLPESFRYHPAHYNHLAGKTLPALVVLARNEENQIQAVQTISLDPTTANKACGKQSKISYGTLSHAGVLVSAGNSDKPTLIAEGPETALSVAEAMPGHTVFAALGSSNFAHMPLGSDVKSVIFAADNDGKDAASVKQLERAANTLSLQGIDVSQVMPEELKQDFNDVLKEKGASEIQTLFKSAQVLQKSVDKEQLKKNVIEAVKHILEPKSDSHSKFNNKEINSTDKDNQPNQLIHEKELKQESISNQLEIIPDNEKVKNSHDHNLKEPQKDELNHTIAKDKAQKVDINDKAYWKQISRESLSIKGTFAERYFENSGLEVKNYNSIRFHPEVWHKETESYLPALIAKSIKVVDDSAAEKGIQIHYLDKETAKQPKVENPLRYMGDASDTVVMLQAPANKDDGRWIVALDINSALTVAQCKPDRLVSLMPSFKEIDKFPISDAGISVTLCADKDFPRQLLDRVIESFHKKNFRLSVLISGKDKSFSQLMREKGKSYVSEQVDKAKRVYSPEIVEIMDKFKEHEEKMLELKDMPSSYKSIEKRKMAGYLKQVNKDKKLVRQLTYQAPEISLRIEKFMQKLKEIIMVR